MTLSLEMKHLDRMSDEELALCYINGSNRAFDCLLDRNQQKLFTYIVFMVHDHEVANDIFQETFFKVISKLQQKKYSPSGKFGAWLMRIAHNAIMDWYREQRQQGLVDASNENDLSNVGGYDLIESNREKDFINTQVLADVKRIMNQLPAPQREVVYMRFYQQMSFKEIAETTGVSINTSLGRMRYAILNMRRIAKEHHIMLELV